MTNWQAGAKWKIKLNPEKTKAIIFSKSLTAIRAEPALSLNGDLLLYCPHKKFVSINSDNRITFVKHFEEILERYKDIGQQKVGSKSHNHLQIYKQCVRPIFEYGIVSTITVSDTVIIRSPELFH